MYIDSQYISYEDACKLAKRFKRFVDSIPNNVKVIITSSDIKICDTDILEEYESVNPDLSGDLPAITTEQIKSCKVIGYEGSI